MPAHVDTTLPHTDTKPHSDASTPHTDTPASHTDTKTHSDVAKHHLDAIIKGVGGGHTDHVGGVGGHTDILPQVKK
jgi:hypothetical protein